MLHVDKLEELYKSIQAASVIASNLYYANVVDPKALPSLEALDRLKAIEDYITSLQQHVSNAASAIRGHFRIGYELAERYYVYRQREGEEPSLRCLSESHGPWHDLNYAVRDWARKNLVGANPSKGKPVKFGVMSYDPRRGNFERVSDEKLQEVLKQTEKAHGPVSLGVKPQARSPQ